ncbi:MAG: hypothetical protein U1E19_10780 [Rhodoblastus sp.]
MAVGDYTDTVSPKVRFALRRARGDSGNADAYLKVERARKLERNGASSELLELLNRETRAYTYATRDGSQTVEIPFSHLMALQSDQVDDDRVSAARFEDAMRRRWRGYIDPELDARVAIYSTPALMEETLIFFGQSVFVPPTGAELVGRVEIERLRDRADPAEPVLPDGRPAAFYAGQNAVAFADSVQRAPATCYLIEEPLTFVLHKSARDGVALQIIAPDGVNATPRALPSDRPSRSAGAYQVSIDHVPAYVIRYDLEISPSRLLREPAPGGFSIAGLVAPSGEASPLRRMPFWYADMEADGLLAAGAFAQKQYSVCVDDGRPQTFDWIDYAFARDKKTFFRLEACAAGGGVSRPVFLLRKAQDNGSFGWLAPPPEAMPWTSASRSSGREYSLEWMRSCIGADPPRSDLSQWLADFDFEGFSVAMRDGVLSTSRPVMARSGPQEPFAPTRALTLSPMAEFLVGPLCLRMT